MAKITINRLISGGLITKCKDPDSAIHTLTRLQRHGLHTLLVAISPFHNKFVTFSKVKGVIEAARRAGVEIFPWITGFIQDFAEKTFAKILIALFFVSAIR